MGTLKSIWGSLKCDRSSSLALSCTERKEITLLTSNLSVCPEHVTFKSTVVGFFGVIIFLFFCIIRWVVRDQSFSRVIYRNAAGIWFHREEEEQLGPHAVRCQKYQKSRFLSQTRCFFGLFFFLGLELSLDARLGSFHASKRPRCRCAQSRRTLVGNPGKEKKKKKRIKSMCLLTCCALDTVNLKHSALTRNRRNPTSRDVVIR